MSSVFLAKLNFSTNKAYTRKCYHEYKTGLPFSTRKFYMDDYISWSIYLILEEWLIKNKIK